MLKQNLWSCYFFGSLNKKASDAINEKFYENASVGWLVSTCLRAKL